MKRINRMIVAKVHIPRYSPKNQEYYQEIELLDPDDNFAWYHTYVSEQNANYSTWRKLLDQDYRDKLFVIEGMFRRSKKADKLVSADAGFVVTETADREEVLPIIAQNINIMDK